MEYDTFKEARKAARKYKIGKMYIGKIKKSNGQIKFIIDRISFYGAEFLVNCKDGRVCKLSNLEAENKLWNRHPEKNGRAFPFKHKVRNRRPDEDKKEYLKDMAIEGRYKNDDK